MPKKKGALRKTGERALQETANLYERVREILDSAKRNVARSVNSEMVKAYWLTGKRLPDYS